MLVRFCAFVGVAAAAQGPCDIMLGGGTPCVAAHSTVRALYSNYDGYIYQVMRASDNATKNIPLLSAGGFANSAVQDDFCRSNCTINRIYDQSPQLNHLSVSLRSICGSHTASNATAEKLLVGGHPVYAVHTKTGDGYRNDNTSGIAKGDEPETIYVVTSGTHYNQGCCFDYGNAEVDDRPEGGGTMEALFFGNGKGGYLYGGNGTGPWIMADLEDGVFGSNVRNATEASIQHTFTTAMLKGDTGPAPGHFAIKGGNAQVGELKTYWDGPRPGGYAPMRKQGAIILGTGGGGDRGSLGTFYEGCITKGFTTDTVDDAVQANIVAAGYAELTSRSTVII